MRLIWLNGPYGVGKTTVANELAGRRSGVEVHDPEHLGFALPGMLPSLPPVTDFQDHRLWRELVPVVARKIVDLSTHTLVMPISVYRNEYYADIVDGFLKNDIVPQVFCRISSAETLRSRIVRRPEREGPHEWALRHLDDSLVAMRAGGFGEIIDTTLLTPK